MIVCALRGAGLDPGYLIGGTLLETGRNSDWGSGEWLVVEADESDGSMLSLRTEIAVLTSVELDHHDRYRSLRRARRRLPRAFSSARRERSSGIAWSCSRCAAGRRLAYDAAGDPARGRRRRALQLCRTPRCRCGSRGATTRSTRQPRSRVCTLVGVAVEPAIASLAGFRGAARRFERLGGSAGGASVYDDYAHHPTEVAATLAAARTLAPKRLVAIFQPHLFSRTKALATGVRRGARGRRRDRAARCLSGARARRGLPRRQRPADRARGGLRGRRTAGGTGCLSASAPRR